MSVPYSTRLARGDMSGVSDAVLNAIASALRVAVADDLADAKLAFSNKTALVDYLRG